MRWLTVVAKGCAAPSDCSSVSSGAALQSLLSLNAGTQSGRTLRWQSQRSTRRHRLFPGLCKLKVEALCDVNDRSSIVSKTLTGCLVVGERCLKVSPGHVRTNSRSVDMESDTTSSQTTIHWKSKMVVGRATIRPRSKAGRLQAVQIPPVSRPSV